MAERNQKVFERVRSELQKNPEVGSRDLYDIAQNVDKASSADTLQQFHARYVLPAKRELKAGGASSPTKRRATTKGRKADKEARAAEPVPKQRRARRPQAPNQPGSDRDRVRAALLQFAQELTDAESRSNLVKVLGRVDTYVDRIVSGRE